MITWLIGKYVESNVTIPGFLLQPLLNGFISLDHQLCRLLGKNYSPGADISEEIAEKSAELMSIHYDMPRGLFENFLGPSMKYSMGLWENGAKTLEEAQEAMMADLCRKAEITDGQTILDVGCGFGSFASHALRAYPKSKVYGLTLSKVQADYIRDKQAEDGHPLNTDRFYLIQDDFNTVTFPIKFDRIVSIGVFEHVSNLGKGLEKVRAFLKPDGACLLHYIVYFRSLYRISSDRPLQNAFIAKHIFPGGRIWSEGDLYKYPEHLRIERDWKLNGSNYRRTLEAWVRNLHGNWGRIKTATDLDDHVLKLWDFYFRACVALFRTGSGNYYGNAQYLLRSS